MRGHDDPEYHATRRSVPDDDPEALGAEFAEEFSLERIAEPVEMATAVLFLASEEPSFVTGDGLIVDGGFSLHRVTRGPENAGRSRGPLERQ
jgi:NAD(P)-dependent dehydrogenase (short-subunit alcohol dehydrogenase family)